ncbi:hypothetical protein RZS28_03755 [Methylocapsa polymorpha]|uniref:Uncharacterized protein n=1 Tax=Methylocapsa polymorpha TaxID=3080828 RepID=A0ABZ0HX04_9HYPH|nr:hypothetical protein RZS28_03755 [Methylocapsa sp. RX1]
MGRANSLLGHHFREVSQAELEQQTLVDAEDDDLQVETTALVKIILHPGSFPQTASLGEYAPLQPFAPEPAPPAISRLSLG